MKLLPTGREGHVFFVLHMIVALALKWGLGLDIQADPRVVGNWNAYWQHIPLDLLQTRMWESILHLHSQPPLHNLYGGLLLKSFGAYQLQAMQYINIFLGSLMSAMFYPLLFSVTGRPKLSLAASVLHALNPALFLYEAYPLYPLPSAFLVLLSVHFVGRYVNTNRTIHLLAFIFTLNILILYRSLFHPVFLAASIIVTFCAAGPGRKRFLACALGISLLSVSWFVKNQVQFGFFGSSSWVGQNLWRIAAFPYTPDELRVLAGEGVIDKMMLEVRFFERPARYRPYGFRETSPVAILSGETLHNINIIAVSRVYGRSAVRLIKHDPYRYLKTVFVSYSIFCAPSPTFIHLAANQRKVSLLSHIWAYAVYGQLAVDLLTRILKQEYIGSVHFFLVPACLIVFFFRLVRSMGSNSVQETLRSELVLVISSMFVLYVTAAGSFLEVGENLRFKLLIESVQLLFFLGVIFPVEAGAGGMAGMEPRSSSAPLEETAQNSSLSG